MTRCRRTGSRGIVPILRHEGREFQLTTNPANSHAVGIAQRSFLKECLWTSCPKS